MNTESDQKLMAAFALFSLHYTTDDIIHNDDKAKDFFLELERRVATKLRPRDYDIDKLIYFSRKGKDWLELYLTE